MGKEFNRLGEIFSGPDVPKIKITQESQPDKPMRRFKIEFKGQKFDFVELESSEPSTTLLVHYPGFAEDAEQYAEYMHYSMGKSLCVLTLKGYGEVFSKESVMAVMEKAIQLISKRSVIFQGDSFGAAVVYDLISDPANTEFLKRNNVVSAILETPFLDKEHLQSRARLIPDKILMRASMLFDKMRSGRVLKSASGSGKRSGLVELSDSQKKSMLIEALREKTAERKIEMPVHVVFSQGESISDNNKITKTLQSQTKEISFSTFKSADDSSHNIADNALENMWGEEKKVIDGFVKPIYSILSGTKPESAQNRSTGETNN